MADIDASQLRIQELQRELDNELASLPDSLQSTNPNQFIDYLATIFLENDDQPAYVAKKSEPSCLEILADIFSNEQFESEVREEASKRQTTYHSVQQDLAKIHETSFPPKHYWHPSITKGSNGVEKLSLVSCNACNLTILSHRFSAHLATCTGQNHLEKSPAPSKAASRASTKVEMIKPKKLSLVNGKLSRNSTPSIQPLLKSRLSVSTTDSKTDQPELLINPIPVPKASNLESNFDLKPTAGVPESDPTLELFEGGSKFSVTQKRSERPRKQRKIDLTSMPWHGPPLPMETQTQNPLLANPSPFRGNHPGIHSNPVRQGPQGRSLTGQFTSLQNPMSHHQNPKRTVPNAMPSVPQRLKIGQNQSMIHHHGQIGGDPRAHGPRLPIRPGHNLSTPHSSILPHPQTLNSSSFGGRVVVDTSRQNAPGIQSQKPNQPRSIPMHIERARLAAALKQKQAALGQSPSTVLGIPQPLGRNSQITQEGVLKKPQIPSNGVIQSQHPQINGGTRGQGTVGARIQKNGVIGVSQTGAISGQALEKLAANRRQMSSLAQRQQGRDLGVNGVMSHTNLQREGPKLDLSDFTYPVRPPLSQATYPQMTNHAQISQQRHPSQALRSQMSQRMGSGIPGLDHGSPAKPNFSDPQQNMVRMHSGQQNYVIGSPTLSSSNLVVNRGLQNAQRTFRNPNSAVRNHLGDPAPNPGQLGGLKTQNSVGSHPNQQSIHFQNPTLIRQQSGTKFSSQTHPSLDPMKSGLSNSGLRSHHSIESREGSIHSHSHGKSGIKGLQNNPNLQNQMPQSPSSSVYNMQVIPGLDQNSAMYPSRNIPRTGSFEKQSRTSPENLQWMPSAQPQAVLPNSPDLEDSLLYNSALPQHEDWRLGFGPSFNPAQTTGLQNWMPVDNH